MSFTKDQLDKLRDHYSGIKTIDPSSENGKKFLGFVHNQKDDALKSLAGAKINFVSMLAKNELKRRGIKEETQLDEISLKSKLYYIGRAGADMEKRKASATDDLNRTASSNDADEVRRSQLSYNKKTDKNIKRRIKVDNLMRKMTNESAEIDSLVDKVEDLSSDDLSKLRDLLKNMDPTIKEKVMSHVDKKYWEVLGIDEATYYDSGWHKAQGTSSKDFVKDKSGAKHGMKSKVRHLARLGLKKAADDSEDRPVHATYKKLKAGKDVEWLTRVSEETINEVRHPLADHDYHRKSEEQLRYIAKDAGEAARAMQNHNVDAENKYRDQASDANTVMYFRKKYFKGGKMPNWYAKKYGHKVSESVETVNELSTDLLRRYMDKSHKDELKHDRKAMKALKGNDASTVTPKQIAKFKKHDYKALNRYRGRNVARHKLHVRGVKEDVMEEQEYFITANDINGHKLTYKRVGKKMGGPIHLYHNNTFHSKHSNIKKAKAAGLELAGWKSRKDRVTENSDCAPKYKRDKDGREVWDKETSSKILQHTGKKMKDTADRTLDQRRHAYKPVKESSGESSSSHIQQRGRLAVKYKKKRAEEALRAKKRSMKEGTRSNDYADDFSKSDLAKRRKAKKNSDLVKARYKSNDYADDFSKSDLAKRRKSKQIGKDVDSLLKNWLGEAVYTANISDADYQKIRSASMRGNFAHKFTRKTNGDTKFQTSTPQKLASDLQKIIDAGETSWSEILGFNDPKIMKRNERTSKAQYHTEGAVPNTGERTVRMVHTTSGKTIVINAKAIGKYTGQGYKLKEEVEHLDELSKGLLQRYRSAAKTDSGIHQHRAAMAHKTLKTTLGPATKDSWKVKYKSSANRVAKRDAGINRANHKLGEDLEPVMEISKDLKKRYLDKARVDVRARKNKANVVARNMTKAVGKGNREKVTQLINKHNEISHGVEKRERSMNRAYHSLHREEVEFDEGTASGNSKLAAQLAARKAQREKNKKKDVERAAKKSMVDSGVKPPKQEVKDKGKNAMDDRHIIMQLRSAQDLNGNKEIQFRRGTGKLDIGTINTILKVHDKFTKPNDKRRLFIAVSKSADDAKKTADKFKHIKF